MKRMLTIAIPVVVVIALGLTYYFTRDHSPKQSPTTTQSQMAVTGSQTASTDKLIIGNPKAPITIVEYADYKCPECNKFYQEAAQDIRKDYIETGKAKIEFRPYPLFGEDSGLALYASFCAAEQGKFAAYHDKMFEYMWQNYYRNGNYSVATKTLFSPEKLGQLAGEAGLDAAAFTTCAGGKTHSNAYYAAVDKAAGDEVQGTPTVLIAGQKVVGPQPYGIYKTLLDIAKS